MNSILLLNDTSNELHVGSTSISLHLRSIAEACGCRVKSVHYSDGRYQVPSGQWDYVIVNSEGTLSRESFRAKALISEIRRVQVPLALVSGDLCAENAEALRGVRFRIVHYRRAHDVNQQVKADTTYVLPDLFYDIALELASGLPSTAKCSEPYWVIGDSHNPADFAELCAFAKKVESPLRRQSMIVERIGAYNFSLPVGQRLRNNFWFASRNKIACWRRRYAAESIESWIGTLARSEGLITGRFHQAIAALAVGVPVRFLETRTNKIKKIEELFPQSDFQSVTPDFSPKTALSTTLVGSPPQFDYNLFFSHLRHQLAGAT